MDHECIDTRIEVKNLNDQGHFSGYGNVFSVIDGGNDVVAPGAFTGSLKSYATKGRLPSMLWQHRSGTPIGAYKSMNEDSMGLHVEGQLALKTQQGAEAYELLKMGAVSGMSIGFETKEASIDQKTGVRTIQAADLWEVSLVTFPMNDQARVAQVKSLEKIFEEIKDWRGIEAHLREVGVSRAVAKLCVAKAKALALRESEGDAVEVWVQKFAARA